MRTRTLAFIAVALCAFRASAWAPSWLAKTSVTGSYSRMLTADFNGDGILDIVSKPSTVSVVIALAQQGVMGSRIEIYHGGYLSDLAIGDVDGDGRTDVLFTDIVANTVIYLRSNGDGTFAPPVTTTLNFAPTYVETGDFDEDGHLDLAVTSYSGAILVVLQGSGAGTFNEVSRLARTGAAYDTVTGDIDHDGHMDVLVANQAPATLHVFFGSGAGAFSSPAVLTAASISSSIKLADLDNDGDLDIVSCDFYPATLAVFQTLQSRTFSAPVSYDFGLSPSLGPNSGDLVVGDFTDDGIPDAVVSIVDFRRLATFEGRGDGTFKPLVQTFVSRVENLNIEFPHYLAAGQFIGDAQLDLLVTTSQTVARLVTFENVAGRARVTLTSDRPTISVGQSLQVTADVDTLDGWSQPYEGEVTFFDASTELGHAVVEGGRARATIEGLPAGVRSLSASFQDDGRWRTSVSSPIEVNVVTTPTVVDLTLDSSTTASYRSTVLLHATSTSEIPGSLSGRYLLYRDGNPSPYADYSAYWSFYTGNVGAHTYQVEYQGDTTHPPARSNIVTVTVTQAPTTIYASFPTALLEGQGSSFETVLQTTVSEDVRTEPLKLYDGNTLVSTFTTYGAPQSLGAMPAGPHYMRVVYEGSQNFAPSSSGSIRVDVLPSGAFLLSAVERGNHIYLQAFYNGSSSYTGSYYFRILRRIGNGPWAVAPNSLNAVYEESNPQPGVLYAYRAQAVTWNSNQLLAESNVDFAMIVSFTDDGVLPGATVKAVHVQQLVAAANVVRAGAGLSPFALAVQPGDLIRASDLESLRNALNEGRYVFGALPIEFETGVATGAGIKAEHIQKLRDSVR